MTKTILVVDDSRTMRDMLRRTLEGAAYHVVDAVDGVDGLEKLDALTSLPAAIITDINMPRMDGYGFIDEVRSKKRDCRVPVLVLTTETSAEKKNRAKKAGATGWIVKPFEPSVLISAIQRVTG
ncbi:response regulator [Acetobacter oeni]|uniref:Two-component system response regulator n=1 Tax=Acetobacter oeni TaxID=304077 RepID=A0A511XLU3_9PROT|nr:response regulator [Acetobacter oeni]MBB3882969.1 two-component system chemotaxis response regulator CheY [Acetobacter oeni]NHO19047.1 response regulator [Acetobacter oeni]GBR09236.1 chemotaxis protein CheY [Acetobacter oeni LMG 21952]GEN63912.1 two-component system response regulator [Acetobacter oeni]